MYNDSSDDDEWPEDKYRRLGKARDYPVNNALRYQKHGMDMPTTPELSTDRQKNKSRLPEYKRIGLYNRDGSRHRVVEHMDEPTKPEAFSTMWPLDINTMMFLLLVCFVISLVVNGFMLGRLYSAHANRLATAAVP